ncbi:hypothetical protein [Acidocella aminolytica]|uniref:Phage terminase small subunit n=1 Tax=Acidocella aminolytica 101 = DSM 11237 TaxID=1120923 RepID=A0A0D6PEL0_9PROT|nr:hypothetical protein [Acidocella aminolytica]GAN79791.1 hypothetical protein Aam_030_024 [Acidocella aminolytica 101 = DSM 11237]GBQ32060.1 hypothetical protein AA11237_0059 [Acidocella aminolytica 101 = DSM 11237]SHF35517.1 hypothetical protein SAMN02746095_02941 [Acidocella aminolytica 101 = DSM 11237]
MQGVKISARQKAAFIAALSREPNVAAACKAAKVGRSAIYALKRENEEFSELWDEVMQTAVDDLEGEAFNLARHGTLEPVVSAGKLIFDPDTRKPMFVKKVIPALILRLLTAHRPEKYAPQPSGQAALPFELTPDPEPTPDEAGPSKPLL